MMVNLLRWPSALKCRGIAFNRRGQVVGGPVSLSGRTMIGSYDGGYWIATVDIAAIDQGDQVLAFRALRAEMEGGAHHLLVPTFDEGQAPWPAAGGYDANVNEPEEWSDSTLWSDGTGWYAPEILVSVAAAASLRDTSIVIGVAVAGTIKAGQYFSLHGGHLHEIKRIIAVNGTERTIAISPPLRAAIAIGERVEFERPTCRMRLSEESEADLALGLLWQGAPAMSFVEVQP
jgi:hypothetical protein